MEAKGTTITTVATTSVLQMKELEPQGLTDAEKVLLVRLQFQHLLISSIIGSFRQKKQNEN